MAAKSNGRRPPQPEPETAPGDLMPQDRELEICALGAILDAPEVAYEPVAAVLAETDLYFHEHRTVYQMMRTIAARGDTPDGPTVYSELHTRDKVEDAEYLSHTLMNYVGSPGLAEQYARSVHELAERRRDIEMAGMLAQVAYSGDTASLQAVRRNIAETIAAEGDEGAAAATDVFPLRTVDELEQIPAARGLIGDVLYEMTLAILYGASQRWKSFVALAWALSIAAGRPWMGKPVVQADVVYIAAEGGVGIGPRVRAWRITHGLSTCDLGRFHALTVPVQLLDPSQVQKLIRTIQQACLTPALIVFDTLSRSMAGGDESSGKDASRALAAADEVRAALSCTALFVAHPGKDATLGIRGWSGYFQWADTVIKAEGGADKPRLEPGEPVTLVCEKPKEDNPFEPITFTTEVVRVVDDAGATLKASLVVIPAAEAADTQQAQQITRKLSLQQQRTLDALNSVPTARLPYGEWKRAARMFGVNAKSTFDDCRDFLVRHKYVAEDNPNGMYASLVRPNDRTSTAVPHRTSTVGTVVS